MKPKARKSKELKKASKEAHEVFEALTGEDEKAGRAAAEAYRKDTERSHDERTAWESNELRKRLKRDISYKDFLAQMLRDRIEVMAAPPGFDFATSATKKGVAVALHSPEGKWYTKGFSPMFNLEIDMNAVEVLATQMENTLYKVMYDESSKK